MAEMETAPGTNTAPIRGKAGEKRLVPVKSKLRFKKEDFRQCRLCMRVVHRNNVRETNGKRLDLRRRILDAVSVKITSYDKVTSVCTNCETAVNMLHDFRMSCRNADTMLRSKRMMMHSESWLCDENKNTLDACQRILKRNRAEIDELYKFSGLGNWSLLQVSVKQQMSPEPEDEPMANFERVDLLPVEEIVVKTEENSDSEPEVGKQYHRALDVEEAGGQVFPRKEYNTHMCEICGELIQKMYIEQHTNKHVGIRPYECSEENCNKRFSSSLLMKMHVTNVHVRQKDRFECKVCHKSIKGLLFFKQHLATHQVDNPLKVPCEVCGKKFYKRYLRDHMFIHTGEMPYKCEFCDRKFAAKTNWTLHRKKQHADLLMAQG